MKRSGFTLIELLVVIAIIGILAALLFSGVFGLLNQSASARNKDNAELLQAAIMEYWHDQGRWPIPKGHKPSKVGRQTHRQTDSEGHEIQGTDYETYQYKLVYGALGSDGRIKDNGNGRANSGNDVIVKILLDAKVGTQKADKRYLDLGPFITTPYEDHADPTTLTYPIEDQVSARGLEEKAISGALQVPLLFQANFIRCPHCGKLYPEGGGRTTCNSRDCDYYKEKNKFYRFTAAELRRKIRGAKPYVITFDFINNKCDVSMP